MAKVLAQAGTSLADIYDVEGSVAGVDTLESKEVHLVHEMGQAIFSERLEGQLIRFSSGDILQSVAFDDAFTLPPAGISRVAAVAVHIDTTARLTNAQVSVSRIVPGNFQDCVVWAWATGAGDDFERQIRIQDAGAAVAAVQQLVPQPQGLIPNMLIGTQQRNSVPQINFRGISAAFGAGTVEAVAVVYIVSTGVTALTNKGLPIPSW